MGALKTAVVAAVSGLGVTSFQSALDGCGGTYVVKGIHWSFAFVFFIAGIVYCVLMWRIDMHVPGLGTQQSRSLRKWFAIGSILQLLLALTVLPILRVTTYHGHIDHMKLTASIIEITLFFTVMSTYVTFSDDFKHTAFSFLVFYDGPSENEHLAAPAVVDNSNQI